MKTAYNFFVTPDWYNISSDFKYIICNPKKKLQNGKGIEIRIICQ